MLYYQLIANPLLRIWHKRRIPLSKGKRYALIDPADYPYVSQFVWSAHRSHRAFYAARNKKQPDGTFKTVFLHNDLPRMEGLQDHVNRNSLDDRRGNLEPTTVQRNNWNKGKRRPNGKETAACSYIGVFKFKGLWRAMIYAEGKRHSLGYFKDPKDAARAYDAAALKFRGESARLNNV